jgi:hypothetical protein
MPRTFIRGSDIAAATISTNNLVDGAVTTAKIASRNVVSDRIALKNIITELIADDAITNLQVANDAINTNELVNNAVTSAKIAGKAVGTSQLADNAVTALQLNANAVETAKILDGNVTTDKLANNAVTPAKAALGLTWSFSDLRGTFGADVSAGSFKLTNVANPVAGTDVANKQYVDGVAQGLDVKQSVVTIAISNITLSGLQTISSVVLTAGQRVLVVGQTDPVQNGIYVAAVGAWTRSADMAAGSDAAGAFAFVEMGAGDLADSGWVCTNNVGAAVVGTASLAFTQFSGAGQITAGQGLSKLGNTLDVNVGNGIAIVSDAVAVKLNASNSGLKVDSNGLAVSLTANATGFVRSAIAVDGTGLAIKVDDSTIDADAAGQLRVKSSGITTSQLANNAVTANQIADNSVVTAKISDGNVTYAKLGADVTAKIGRFDAYEKNVLSGSAPFSITLASAPQTSDSALLVFLNGIMRVKNSDYTLSGSTITFDATVGGAGDDWAVYYGLST